MKKQTTLFMTLCMISLSLFSTHASAAYDTYVSRSDRSAVSSTTSNTSYSYYSYDGWGMDLEWYDNVTPRAFSDESLNTYYIDMPSAYGDIKIYSYGIGNCYDWGKADNINSVITKEVALWKDLAMQGNGNEHGSDFEVLSESDTTVGNMPAHQAEIRVSFYTNKEQTKADYVMLRFIAFKHDNYIYVIHAYENSYSWNSAFLDEIELVRTSICF